MKRLSAFPYPWMAPVLIAALATPAAGQPATSRDTTRIFVQDFEGDGTGRDPDFRRLLPDLILVELLRLPNAATARTSPPACRASTQVVAQQKAPRTTRQPLPQEADSGRATTGFYVVTGHFEASPRLAVDYLVSRCSSEGLEPILPGHQLITESRPLPDLLSIARAVTGRLTEEVPRIAIAVRELEHDPESAEARTMADLIHHRISDVIWALGDAEPVPEDGLYDVTGRVTGFGSRLVAEVRVSRGDSPTVGESVVVADTVDSRIAFAEQVATAVAERLQRLRFGPRVAGGSSRDELLQRAERSLCVDVESDCAPNPDAAAAVLRIVLERDGSDAEALALLGRAELMGRRVPEAVRALEQAVELAHLAREIGRPYPEDWHAAILVELAEAQQAGGNAGAAAESYSAAVGLAPDRPELYVEWSRTLRSAGRPLRAFEAASAGLTATGEPGLTHEADVSLGALTSDGMAGEASRLVEACGSTPDLRDTCASRMVDVAAGLVDLIDTSRLDPDRRAVAETILRAALAVDPPTEALIAHAAGRLAQLYVGSTEFRRAADGSLEVLHPGFEAERAEEYLGRTDELDAEQLDPEMRLWLLSLHAHFWKAQGDLDRARELADRASTEGGGGVGQVEFLWAEIGLVDALRLREVAEGEPERAAAIERQAVGLLEDAAMRLEELLLRGYEEAYAYLREAWIELDRPERRDEVLAQLYRENASFADQIAYHCIEELHDFACGLGVMRARMEEGSSGTVDEGLEGVEAALLAGEVELAQGWLTPILNAEAGHCTRMVGLFYAHWLASLRGDGRAAGAYFEEWRETIGRARADWSFACWIFEGAKTLARADASLPDGELLVAMMEAMEDRDLPIPVRPGSGSGPRS